VEEAVPGPRDHVEEEETALRTLQRSQRAEEANNSPFRKAG
jgi:hypothetical protein